MLHGRLGNKSASPLGPDTISSEEACLISLQIFHSRGLELSLRTHRCGRTVGHGKGILLLIGGSAPAHGVCSHPAHTARALGWSAGNNPRLALGCIRVPGPSRSGSGTQAVLRGADSVGAAFCALPRSEQHR